MSSQVNITLGNSEPVTAVVGLGSNIAYGKLSVAEVIGAAIVALESLSSAPLLVSSCYRTEPLDCAAGTPYFINAIAIVTPQESLSALTFLAELQRIERRFGRSRKRERGRERLAAVNQSRALDLDLICWGNLISDEDDLLLPHPRAHLRRFVLAPLAELAPDLLLPGQTVTVQQLLLQLHVGGAASRLSPSQAIDL
jgi:2-amino-4-hydroxy-6-hydroxymethyldihydropteridine diphosphokinase